MQPTPSELISALPPSTATECYSSFFKTTNIGIPLTPYFLAKSSVVFLFHVNESQGIVAKYFLNSSSLLSLLTKITSRFF